ncbi:MAG: iron-sulfur cluster insertion protein ErpA [Legionellales bacterium]|nr:MAG: iron-sulfur cluster insertion protein ErpA [Legionellales bacterium]
MTITMTTTATTKVNELLESEGDASLKLRVYIVGGGCSGFQYGFGFDAKKNTDDTIMQDLIIVDPLSINYLDGATIDYKNDLQGARFVVDNPNATTTCGCGSSFSID